MSAVLELERVLEKDRSLLLLRQPFTAALAMRLRLVGTDDRRIPTAATDGLTVFFNVNFAASVDTKTRQFVLCHEVWHCVMGHLTRRQGRDPERWNRAVDYEVNHICQQLLDFVPDCALYNHDWCGRSAEAIYPLLAGFDDLKGQAVMDSHLPITAEVEQAWREFVIQTMGSSPHWSLLPGNLRNRLSSVLQPALPWQQILQRFVQRQLTGDRQWFPPSRRHIHRGLYLPRQRSEFIELTVALDTSGSCAGALGRFLGQLQHLLAAFSAYEVTILQCDTHITDITMVTPDQPLRLEDYQLKGYGGTRFDEVLDYVEQNSTNALVFFTDGYVHLPVASPSVPVLWILTSLGADQMPWGEVAHLPS